MLVLIVTIVVFAVVAVLGAAGYLIDDDAERHDKGGMG
jgi:hypothetical protein